MSKFTSYCVLSGAALAAAAAGAKPARGATLIYGFNDPTISGFTGNSATTSQSTTTGVTEGAGALEIANKTTQTYGGAITATVPATLYNATSFNVDVTITTTPVAGTPAAPVYFDLVPIFFSTDGEIDPDTSNAKDFINIGGVAPGTYTYTVNLAAYFDPGNGGLTTDSTPGQILAADQKADGNTTDQITGFQLTVEHGSGTATTLFVDNLTVPSAAVPEPASLGIIGIAGLTLVGRRRRQRA